jgi:hypothetical protein
MRKLRSLLPGAIGIIVAASPLLAHHAWPVDRSKEVTVKGTVTAYTWSDPHVMIALDVVTPKGAVEKWNVGGPSMNRMAGNGWDKGTLKPGDVITGIGSQFTDGSKVVQLQKIILANGKEMFLYGRPPGR